MTNERGTGFGGTHLARRDLLGGAAGATIAATAAVAGSPARAIAGSGSAARSDFTPRREHVVGGGLSKVGLQRMHASLARDVESGYVPGLVTLISRGGDVVVDAIGKLAFDSDQPMQRDTIFRIASVTKPVTAAAAMMLIEESVLRLDDPVDELLPELANRQVLRSIDAELDDTVPANRPITLRDLLTFRLGYGAVMVFPPSYPIQEATAKAGIGAGAANPNLTADELMKAYGSLPLLHQPGEEWHEGAGADILGVMIARATGQSLGDFMQERIFDPLGMKDTSFSIPAEKLDRLPTLYMKNFTTGELDVFDGVANSDFVSPPFESGAGGLLSTADDLLAFGQMMLNNGPYQGRLLLSRPSIEVMTTDQITPEQKARSPFFPGFWDNHGWGFGVSVITKRDDSANTPGRYGWDAGWGTSWYVDPTEGLIGILMTQRTFDALAAPPTFVDFWTSAYAAIDD
jgi:CubicO group peptidase (beta-lactamase class C family)